jgi:acetylornithine deacetylase/succinyl-diaminopimelate desuccinylase-like protein
VGKPSVNVGMISGGIAPNVVAPRCRVEFDWRVVPPETIGEVKDKIAGILDRLKSEGWCLGWEMEQFQNNDALSTPGDSALVEELAAACKASGLEGRRGGVRWCCDASVFCGRSGETVVFGPGSIKQGHASDEWIDVEELEKAADALSRLLGGKVG